MEPNLLLHKKNLWSAASEARRMTCSSWVTAQRSAVRSALAKVSLEPVIFLVVFCQGMIGK
jgi:hypothetical protein